MAGENEQADTIPESEDVSKPEVAAKDADLVEVGQQDEREPHDDDPRAAIYKRVAEQRQSEIEEIKEPENLDADQKPDDEELVTVKVNGKERQVTRAKVDAAGGIDAYQKNAAASEMLNQAAAERRRLAEYEKGLEQRAAQIAAREEEMTRAATQRPAELPDKGALNELAAKYHEALLEGEMDTASELLIKMQEAQRATSGNGEEIANLAVQRAKAELAKEEQRRHAQSFEAERVEANDEFQTNYEDLAIDPVLRDMVNQRTAEIYHEHPEKGPKAIIKEAAESIRGWVSQRLNGAQEDADERRQAAKRAQSVRGGSARVTGKPAPRPQTNSEYVSQLRKQRGLGE